MKRIHIFLIAIIAVATLLHAEDLIVMRNGDVIKANVLEISKREVKYKKASRPDGPTYITPTADLLSINYENGEKDTFEPTEADPAASASQGVTAQSATQAGATATDTNIKTNASGTRRIKCTPAENNAELIAQYNKPFYFEEKHHKNKPADNFTPIIGVGTESLLSTPEIEITFVPTYYLSHYGYQILRTCIEIYNKTDDIIYIDKAQSFRIFNDGSQEPIMSTENVTTFSNNSSGGSIGLGGIAGALGIGGAIGSLASSIGVSSGNQNGSSSTYTDTRIISIPPHAKSELSVFKEVKMSNDEWKELSDYEYFNFSLPKAKKGIVDKGGLTLFDEEQSPYNRRYLITYSSDPNFLDYYQMEFSLFCRAIIGDYISLERNRDKHITKIQKYVPDFWNNPHLLVGNGSNYTAFKE